MNWKKFLTIVLLSGSVMTIGPEGMKLGTIDNQGNFMTTGKSGMTLGNISPDGSYFELNKKGMTLGTMDAPEEIFKSKPKSDPFDLRIKLND